MLFDVDLVEQLPADRAPDRLVAGLHAGVADGDALHREQGLDLIVLGQHAVAVGDQDAAPAVGDTSGDLVDGASPPTVPLSSARVSSATLAGFLDVLG